MGRTIKNVFPFPGEVTEEELQKKLRPKGDNEQLMYGYLGSSENLETIIRDDEQALKRLGVSHDQIAKTIEDMFFHVPRSINNHRLYLFDYIHSPVCPWGDYCAVSPFDYTSKTTEIWLCNRRHFWKLRILLKLLDREDRLKKVQGWVQKDWMMIFSDLHPHLIRDHKFLEGHSTPYRVDPDRFVRYFGRQNICPYQ